MFSTHDLPEFSHPYKGSKILILVAQLGKYRPREGRLLAQGHAGDGDRVSRPSRVSVADPPPPPPLRAWPLQSQPCAGARIPPLSVRQPSVWVSTRLQRCTPPQPPVPRRERQALAAPGPRPTPQPTDGSACARAPHSGGAGAGGAKARHRRRHVSHSLAAL